MDGGKNTQKSFYHENKIPKMLSYTVFLGVKYQYLLDGKNNMNKINAWCHFEVRDRGQREHGEQVWKWRGNAGRQAKGGYLCGTKLPLSPVQTSSLQSEILHSLFL